MADSVEQVVAEGSASAREALREALSGANLPTLLLSLAHLTGDDRWLQAPYRPTRPKGPGDNDSAGLPEEVQAEIRDSALELVSAFEAGELEPAPPPSPERVAEMLSISLGGATLPEGFGPLLAEELGVEDRDVEFVDPPPAEQFEVLVIGAGFSGLLSAIKLKEAGIAYTLVEKAESVGGTWLENTYPGAGVDTPTHLYSLSFAQQPDWSRYFAKRDELNDYLQRLADDNDVRSSIRFGVEVTEAVWNEAEQRWDVKARNADGGELSFHANALVTGVGFFNRPAFPSIEGLDAFEGPVMHTAQWRDDVEIEGKRVAVIGTGASAMQLVPNIAGVADRVLVFQRTPQWGIPHPNYMRDVTPKEQTVMARVPNYLGWYRLRQLWNFGDRLHKNVLWDPEWPHTERSISAVNESQRAYLTEYIREELGDRAEELMPKCLPDYPPYGKRPLLDNGWFRTMARDDVDLITEGIAEVRSDRIVMVDGEEHPVDVLVLASGFKPLQVLSPIEIRGRSGRTLREAWGEDDARAYLGITVADFPNLFCLFGPNTFAGHGGSGVLSIELELRYTLELFAIMFDRGLTSVEVREDVYDAYNAELDEALSATIWAHPGMTTYYRNSKGRIVIPMPWTNVDYWQRTREPKLDEYIVQPSP